MAIGRNKKTGRFTPNNNKWMYKDNIFYCYRDGELLFFTDDERVVNYSWGKVANGYAGTKINGENVLLHRFISRPKENELVDHINRNKKDNRKCNLRNTNKSVNAFNSKIRNNNKSGVPGVRYRKDTHKWTAEIRKNSKKISLGCYETKEEAKYMRKCAEAYYYGDK